jgi:aryl-alcohol dehydrogenase-like predicted oxidoreductase/enamine deaminase RidA (YjgF/YER057c/UK114 family)
MSDRIERYELTPGFTISRALTGLWQVADMERDGGLIDLEVAAQAMRAYVEKGLTTFDMADHYGSAEDIAGIFLDRHVPGDLVQVATKWVPKPGRVSRQDVRAAVERSLARLRSETIDLLQFHAWSYADPSYLDCLFWLQELRDEGLIRHLGLTNFDTAHLRMVLTSGIEVVSNQVSFSLLDRRAQGAMTDLCAELDVGLLAYGTLAGGLLTERFMGLEEPAAMATWSQMKYKRFLDVAGGWGAFQELLRTLAGVAATHDVSIANVAARYILQQPAVAGVIIGARLGQREHIDDTLRLFGFSLDEEEMAQIERSLDGFDRIPGDCGDEYRRPPFLTASGDLSDHLDGFPPPFETVEGEDGRTRVLSGTRWEDEYGYCRAIREGDRIRVSGTTASHGDRLIGGTDAAAQACFVLDKIEGALRSLGCGLEDVVRTRVFVADVDHWESVARAHGERFAHVRPVNTLVEARLVGPEYLVEIEAEAVVAASKQG